MTRQLTLLTLLALAACSSQPTPTSPQPRAGTVGLPAFDARAAAAPHPTRFVDPSLAGPRLSPGSTVRVDERMGQPTFVWTSRAADPAQVAAVKRLGPEAAARATLAELAPLYSLPAASAVEAELASLHDTGRGGIIARFRQRVQGVPVFGASLSVLMDRDLQPLALTGNLSPDAALASRSPLRFDLDEADAIDRALTDLHGTPLPRQALGPSRLDQAGARLHQVVAAPAGVVFSRPPRTRPVLFQLPDRLEPATYVELMAGAPGQRETAAYAWVFSAVDGRMLLRHDLTAHDAFGYRVWAGTTAPYLPANGPQGTAATPYPAASPSDLSFAFTPPALVTLQNAPFSRNDPWLPAGATQTTGNNVDAYADLSAPDGFNAGDYRADITSAGVFDRVHDPALPPAASPNQVKASVTHLFFINNFLHDWFYDSGLDEASGNAQQDNYGRGGAGGDPIHAEAQDSSGTSNANMATPADGGSPRMQMYVWTGGPKDAIEITAPVGIAGKLTAVGGALFGPGSFDVTGALAQVDDGSAEGNLGCNALTNGAAVIGKIALVTRGTCTFTAKVLNAQAAGAIAVLVVNNVDGLLTMAGTEPAITIPALLVTLADGARITAQLTAVVTAHLTGFVEPDRDGTVDSTVVAHEWGHYVSNRLIGDANGLNNSQGGGLGEGWSDFIALLMVVREGDTAVVGNASWGGTYALAAYAALTFVADPYYYGIRRVPYSTDLAKDGLSFRHISDGVALPAGPPTAFGQNGASNSEVHNTGEVWASMLWECYAALLRDSSRLSFAEAQQRMKDDLIASLKLTPPNPTLLEARDALLAAALASDPADHRLFLEAFARRGAGTRAVGPDRYSLDHAGVVESLAAGNDVALVSATLDDSTTAPCGTTGVLSAGGAGLLTVTLRNVGPDPLAAITAEVGNATAGLGFPGGTTLTFGSMARGATATATLPVTLAASVTGVQTVALTLTVNGAALATPLVVQVVRRANYDALANQSALDDVESPATTWTVASGTGSDPAAAWRRVERAPDDHRWLSPSLATSSDEQLVSPPIRFGAGPATITFTHRFDYPPATDTTGAEVFISGGVVEVSTTNGTTWSDLGQVTNAGYNGIVDARITGPLSGRRAFTGSSAGFPARVTSTMSLGTRYAGQTILVRFRSALYPYTPAFGWEVDDIGMTGTIDLPFNALVGRSGACAQVPTAVASAPADAIAGSPVQLDGTASSDPDHRPLTWRWVQVAGPVATVDDTTAAQPHFTVAAVAAPTPVTFALRVSNGQRWSAPAEVTVSLSPPPAPPPSHGGGCSSGGAAGGSLAPLLLLVLGLALRRRRGPVVRA